MEVASRSSNLQGPQNIATKQRCCIKAINNNPRVPSEEQLFSGSNYGSGKNMMLRPEQQLVEGMSDVYPSLSR